MKKILLLLLISVRLLAQPNIKIPVLSHDFGSIEEGVQASYTFEVENTGNQPLIISNVKPSCGCTTPDWTKTPIAPGKKGFITATYNSQGRPGSFTKIISVETNAQANSTTLNIKGFVGPKTEKTYSAEEKKNSPLLVIERSSYNFGKVETGQTIRQKIRITNNGKTALKVSGIQSGCRCVDYSVKKSEFQPGESGEVEFLYKPVNLGDQTDIVTMVTNDIANEVQKITFKANVVENFGNGSILNPNTAPSPFK